MTATPDPQLSATGAPKSDMSWTALTSLICGAGAILTICISFIPYVGCFCVPVGGLAALAGIVFAILGWKSPKASMAKIGLALCIAYFLLWVVVVIIGFIFGLAMVGASGGFGR